MVKTSSLRFRIKIVMLNPKIWVQLAMGNDFFITLLQSKRFQRKLFQENCPQNACKLPKQGALGTERAENRAMCGQRPGTYVLGAIQRHIILYFK